GVWQGFWIAYIRIPAFIVTLAGMLLFRGLTNTILKGLTLSPFPRSFQSISSCYLLDFFPAISGFNLTPIVFSAIFSIFLMLTQVKKRRAKIKSNTGVMPPVLFISQLLLIIVAVNLFACSLAAYKGIPIILMILLALIAGYHFFTTKTVPGRYIYAMGGNERAAQLSGINTNRVLFFVYLNMAVLSAVAGIVFAARTDSAFPLMGSGFEL